ncbi:hypothetical protein ACWD5O_30565, partial [Micromonospora sp. NPDC005161]
MVPLVTAFYYGLFEWDGTRQGAFVGIGNYQEIFTRYPLGDEIPAALGPGSLRSRITAGHGGDEVVGAAVGASGGAGDVG